MITTSKDGDSFAMTERADISHKFIGSGSEMRDLIRAFDWSSTSLGPIDSWSPSLKTVTSIVLSSQNPMFLWWGPELIQIYNDAYVPSFGEGKHPAAIGQRGADCWQEIWPVIWPQIKTVRDGGDSTWHEDQLIPIYRNGHLEDVYWSYTYTPVFDESDAVAGVLVVCTETTRRVLAERRQQALTFLTQRIYDAESEAEIYMEAGYVAQTNPHDIRFILEAPINSQRQVNGKELTVRRSVVLDADDRHFSLSFGISPTLSFDVNYQQYLDHFTAIVGAAMLRVEKALANKVAAEDRYHLLMNAPVGTATFTGDDLVVDWANHAYCDIIGRYDIIGKTFNEVFPELDGTPMQKVFFDVYSTGEAVKSSETQVQLVIKGELQNRYYTYNLVPLRNLSGGIYGLWVIVVDITEQVAARKETERLNDELSIAARAKDEFLAMLGHELRNPLAPIVTALELMKFRNADTSREHQVIERQVNHMVRLVDDLLDVSKITRGKIDLRPDVVEVRDVLNRAVEMADYLLDEKKHHLTIETSAAIWFGDPARLSQVVANLLTNAARYTPEGGNIHLTADIIDDVLEIVVMDDGTGIAPNLLPYIFEPFLQGSRNSDRREGGLGIGLSIVKNLVELHGGSVVAASDGVGQGSTFTIRLPAQAGAMGSPKTPANVPPFAGESKSVLIVDDNADAADILAELLNTFGHQVWVAYDPVQAIDQFEKVAPDVVILDIGLPVMDGYDLAQCLTKIDLGKPCHFIALTGYGQERDKSRSETSGFSQHLVKPVDVVALHNAISQDRLSACE